MFGKKRKKRKVLSRIKVSVGLFFGMLFGMAFSPRKGRKAPNYFKTKEFKSRLKEAQGRIELIGEFFKEAAQKTKRDHHS